jgi:hypothetical protein
MNKKGINEESRNGTFRNKQEAESNIFSWTTLARDCILQDSLALLFHDFVMMSCQMKTFGRPRNTRTQLERSLDPPGRHACKAHKPRRHHQPFAMITT